MVVFLLRCILLRRLLAKSFVLGVYGGSGGIERAFSFFERSFVTPQGVFKRTSLPIRRRRREGAGGTAGSGSLGRVPAKGFLLEPRRFLSNSHTNEVESATKKLIRAVYAMH